MTLLPSSAPRSQARWLATLLAAMLLVGASASGCGCDPNARTANRPACCSEPGGATAVRPAGCGDCDSAPQSVEPALNASALSAPVALCALAIESQRCAANGPAPLRLPPSSPSLPSFHHILRI